MSVSDKALGFVLLSAALVIFLYYSVWVLLLPFVEENHPLHSFFLAKEYAIAIPAILLVVGLVVIGMFIGFVMVKEAQKSKKK